MMPTEVACDFESDVTKFVEKAATARAAYCVNRELRAVVTPVSVVRVFGTVATATFAVGECVGFRHDG
jgi:hypothetical protein